jgi:predicted nucleic acid-binding protein
MARSGEMVARTDVEALQEVLHYYHRRGVTELGAGIVGNALIALPAPFPITVAIVDRARRLLLDHSRRLASRDAIHAAVVLEHHLEGIISADRAFDTIPGITRFDPRDL